MLNFVSKSFIMNEQIIFRQIQLLPPALQKEVLDFIGYLLVKHNSEQKPTQKRPKFGSAKGRYQMAPDFDAPLEIFNDYME